MGKRSRVRHASTKAIAKKWYEDFNRLAGDLYPDRYTKSFCAELADQAVDVRMLAWQKGSTIVAHNYQFPELHEVADFVGDSLGLSFRVRDAKARRVDFSSVHFMGATAKIIVGDATRVFVQGDPAVHSCSLVRGTDHAWVQRWKDRNPGGTVVTYVNSDVLAKTMSDYISTSANTDKIIVEAARQNPGKKILVMPDKFLGLVMKARALELAAAQGVAVDPDQIEVYTNPFAGYNACCYVHERIGADAPEEALDKYEDSELLLHPECGCASACLFKLNAGLLPKDRVYYRSTEGMLERVRESSAKTFVIGTEKGMIYRLRKLCPDRTFHPISDEAVCDFMKQNAMAKLLASLRDDRYEIVFDDEVAASSEVIDGNVIRLNRAAASRAKVAIDRMLTIK
jgi:quinolinate synthase